MAGHAGVGDSLDCHPDAGCSRPRAWSTRHTLKEGKSVTEAEMKKAADKGRIAALMAAADWLETKSDKSRQHPGADLVRAEARADAYDNAAMTLRAWATK